MTKPAAMTELEAVNVLLTTIGEAPVNTLTGKQTTDVAIAQQVLNEVNREVQSRGWHFNTEYDVELIPDTSNNILHHQLMLSVLTLRIWIRLLEITNCLILKPVRILLKIN